MTSQRDEDLLNDPEAWSEYQKTKNQEALEIEEKTAKAELEEELESLSKLQAYHLGMTKIIALLLVEDKSKNNKNVFLAKLVKFTMTDWYNGNPHIQEVVDWHLL